VQIIGKAKQNVENHEKFAAMDGVGGLLRYKI